MSLRADNGNNYARRKKSSVYQYTRFPVINDEEEEESEEGSHGSGGVEVRVVSRKMQLLGALTANMGALALGTVLSYPAVALPSLRDDTEFKNLTKSQESWIGSIVSLGAVAAGPVGGYLIETMGRKGAMAALSLPFFLGWLLIHFASSVNVIIIGRFITGFFSGTFAVAAPIFTAEITDAGIRGAVGATFDMMISLGILFIYVVGTFVHWRLQALICSIIPVCIFLLSLTIPESPFYLVKKGKFSLATDALMKYRGIERINQVLPELGEIMQEVEKTKACTSFKTTLNLLFLPWILLPVFIGFMIYMFQVISGLDPVLIYTVDIFHLAGANLDEYSSTIIMGTMQTLAGVVAAFFVDRCGRRFLLLISETFMIISLGFLGLYFYLKEANGGVAPPSLGFLPVTTLTFYVLSYSVGMGPVGYTLMGEILPLQLKGFAGCILTSAKWFMSFLVTISFQDLIGLLGEAGCFWLFAGMCFLGLVFVFFMVPETKGKSLDEIQQHFRTKFGLEEGGGENSPLIVTVDEPSRSSGYESI